MTKRWYRPILISETTDFGHSRFEKISAFIDDASFSIHDLSRTESIEKTPWYKKDKIVLPRMNMPFELGVAFGYKFAKNQTKNFLIFESIKYETQKVLSDLAGRDPFCHYNDSELLSKV